MDPDQLAKPSQGGAGYVQVHAKVNTQIMCPWGAAVTRAQKPLCLNGLRSLQISQSPALIGAERASATNR